MEQRSKLIGGAAIGGAVLLGTALLMRAHSRRRLHQRYDAGVMSQLGGDPDDYQGLADELTGCTASEPPNQAAAWRRARKQLRRMPKWMRKVGPDRP